MIRLLAVVPLVMVGCAPSRPAPAVVSLCDLSRNFAAYRDQVISVRGVYYYGLRETCPQKCANGPWPSFLDLTGAALPGSGSGVSDDSGWAALARVMKDVKGRAKAGRRFEIRVTAVGQLKTGARRSPLGPCDAIGSGRVGYGHLGAFPAELAVQYFGDITVQENFSSPYDYGKVVPGPA